jgi:hypothetical protein
MLWQGKIKGCARVGFGLGPNVAAMAIDNALRGRKAHASAGEFTGRVQTLEYTEQPVRIRHIEPGSIVAHEEGALSIMRLPHLDARSLSFRGELPGILQ